MVTRTAIEIRMECDTTNHCNCTGKEKSNTWTVLQIVNVKNKHIPYKNISILHPEIQDKERSKEAGRVSH